MSMEAFKHLCASLLKRLTTIASYTANTNNNNIIINMADTQISGLAEEHPNDSSFNPHMHPPLDRHLLLCCSTTLSEAIRASLPVVLYRSLMEKFPSSPISLTSSPISNTQIALPELNTAPPPHDLPSLWTTSSTTTISLSCNLSPSYRNMASSSSSSSSSSNLQRSASTFMSTTQHLYFHEQKKTGSPITSQLPQMVTFDQCEEACNGRTECAICLCELQGEQEVRELPKCRHIFHKHCIDGWILHNHHTCPLCRSSLLTPPVVLHKMLHEQSEISFQMSSWFSSVLEEEEEEEDAYIRDHFHHQHQTFFFPLQQPAGHGITES
ncbi:hypothetical protein L7F22_008855 [Adiantum nelumboides]|nr:hypothetical protein [Adiantum nelumboides]